MPDKPDEDSFWTKPIHEHPDDARIRLYWWHKRAGTLGEYYLMYPLDRPAGEDPGRPPRGRGR